MSVEREQNRERTALYMQVREACRRALAAGVTRDELETALGAADTEVQEAKAVLYG